jgi:GAF domain-containing protein
MARSVRDIEGVLGDLLASDEPAVVLSSLARASNPAFSDSCAVELSEGTDVLFQVSFPLPDDPVIPAAGNRGKPWKSITTPFQAPSGYGFPSFAGVVIHSWTGHHPTDDDAIIARLLVDQALAVLQRERMVQALARADDRAAKLAIELITRQVRPAGRALPSCGYGYLRAVDG